MLHSRSSLSCQFIEDFIFASWVFSVRKKGIWKEKKVLRCKFASWKAADGFRRCFKAVIALGTWHLHGVTFRPNILHFVVSLFIILVRLWDIKSYIIFEVGCSNKPAKNAIYRLHIYSNKSLILSANCQNSNSCSSVEPYFLFLDNLCLKKCICTIHIALQAQQYNWQSYFCNLNEHRQYANPKCVGQCPKKALKTGKNCNSKCNGKDIGHTT